MMDMAELIPKINALANKKKTVGLTPEEQQEQDFLRQEYLKLFRAQMRGHLDRIVLVDKEQIDNPEQKH